MRALKEMSSARTALLLFGAAGVIAGCGQEDFKNESRPPTPISLTGVIQDRGVTVSPSSEGAGPLEIKISNQTDEAHTVTLEGNEIKETVGPIQPQGTGTIQKTLTPGEYEVRAGSPVATSQQIPPAQLTIDDDRDSSSDRLLLP